MKRRPGSLRRRPVLVIGAALAGLGLLAATIVVVVLVTRGGGRAAPAHRALPQARVQQLQTALSSPDPATQAGALDPAVFAGLQQSGRPLLPPGSKVTIDPATAKVAGHVATVAAKVTGPRQGRFVLQLALENGTWVVFAAEPK